MKINDIRTWCRAHRGVAVLLLTCLATLSATAQNLLHVDDFTAAAGKEASVPIYLDNSDEVVGMQFNIELPYARSSSDVTLVSSRSNGHSVSLRRLSDKKYTVVVMSMQNNALRGNSGLVMRFPVQVSDEAQADDQLPVKLTDIVLTSRQGHNVATERANEAVFTVLRTPTPDFVVSGVQILNSGTIVPGGKLQLSFQVTNQGTGESKDGWTEKIYLEDLSGYRVYVGQKTYTNTLAEETSVPRTYEVDIPQVVKTDGTVKVVVELVPMKNAGELIADQGNNTATSAGTVELAKRLFLSESRILLEEGKSQRITLTRSGDWSMDETFDLVETGDESLLSLPATVTIPAKQSAVAFTVTAVDNDEVNANYRTGIKATGDDYPDVTMIVDVQDNDNYPLSLTLDKTIYDEGDDVVLTATIKTVRTDDLKINITNTATARFYPYVRSITIPAGQLQAQATTKVVDDNNPMADVTVTFTATADGFETAKATVVLRDDDWPTLTMKLSPTVISEGDGYGAAMAAISREGNTAENVTIFVTSTSGDVYFDSNRNIIPAGQKSITIPVSVKDNSAIDGDRTATITAAACDAQTGQAATRGSLSFCEATLKITDDDAGHETLKLQSQVAQLIEGGSEATVTLTRNTTTGDCVVTLTSDDDQLVLSATTVTIKDGSKTATFTVKATKNAIEGDDHYASITATADGYQTASFVFAISDNTLPQSSCGAPVLSTATAYGGQTITATLTVDNEGTATLKEGMDVTFYLSTDRSIRVDYYYKSPMQQLAVLPTTKAVKAGESEAMDFTLTLPANLLEREYYLFAWLNREQKTEEVNAYHNPSATAPIMIKAPFQLAELSTDRTDYRRGETVMVTGRMSNAESGVAMEGNQADIYLVDTQSERMLMTSATMDAQGHFTAEVPVGSAMGGNYGIGACNQGAGTADVAAHLNVVALGLSPRCLKLTLTEGVATEGEVKVTNLSGNAMKNVALSLDGMPEGWQVTLGGTIATLQTGATASVHYSITPTTSSDGQRYSEATLTATATDQGTDALQV